MGFSDIQIHFPIQNLCKRPFKSIEENGPMAHQSWTQRKLGPIKGIGPAGGASSHIRLPIALFSIQYYAPSFFYDCLNVFLILFFFIIQFIFFHIPTPFRFLVQINKTIIPYQNNLGLTKNGDFLKPASSISSSNEVFFHTHLEFFLG